MRSRWTLAAALLLTAACNPLATAAPAIGAPAAASYRPSPATHRGGTLVLGDWEFPQTLDIYAAATDADFRAASVMYSPLWGLDAKLQPYPDLVREVPTVQNGDVKVAAGGAMTVLVRLLPGLHWSDGAPLTADDVVYTWQSHAQAFPRLLGVQRRSDTDVVWSFGSVFAPYLEIGPQFWVVPAHHPQPAEVVSGPFVLAGQVAGQSLTYAANPHYADGRRGYFAHPPDLDRVVDRVYPSKAALLAGLRAGEADLGFNLDTGDLHDLQGMSGSAPLVFTGLRSEFLNPNHAANAATGQSPPWVGDPAVLDALDRALDRPALLDAELGGQGRPSRALFPSALRSWVDPAAPGPTRDLEGARQLLDGDGWKAGVDGVRQKGARRLQFELLAACGTAAAAQEVALLKQQWQDVGASVATGCQPRSQFFGQTNPGGRFDMTVYSNQWLADPDAWAVFGASGSSWNRCQDPKVDAALGAGAATLDPAKRQADYLALQREWLAYHCTIPLYEWPELRQVAGGVHNFLPAGGPSLDTWNAADWWLG
ncbi:MAG TPA: ABC transporter substrate-binding protein [Candidatus Dormibacteraeota bacterium]